MVWCKEIFSKVSEPRPTKRNICSIFHLYLGLKLWAWTPTSTTCLFRVSQNRSEENKLRVSFGYFAVSDLTFFAAERLKINLKPRNMKNQKKNPLQMYYRKCYFANKPYNSADGFLVSVTSSVWVILLSICFSVFYSWRVPLQNTNIGKQIASRKKTLRAFACCWSCSCSPYVIRKMWGWHTTAFHKRDHEACTRDALYSKIIPR